MIFRAPAKVNLGLAVCGRRPDGYHELASVFVPLDLADEIDLEWTAGGSGKVSLELSGEEAEHAPGNERNLAARAAAAGLAEVGGGFDLRLHLTKRIPVGAGLGGGSSDAGAVLRAIASRIPPGIPPERLAGIALSLGADVPFFLDPRPAWVTGIGERVVPLLDVPGLALLLATPAPPLATADVYRAFDEGSGDGGAALTLPAARRTMPALSGLRDGVGRLRRDLLVPLLANDLEPAAQRLHPEIRRVQAELLRTGAAAVGMSGSGPSVLGVFEDAAAARAALGRVRFGPSVRVRFVTTTPSP